MSDNSSPGQLAPSFFIHYRAKRAAKYMNTRLKVIQIILRSFIHYRVWRSRANCLGLIVQGASCLTLAAILRNTEKFIDIGECTKTLSLSNTLMLRYLRKVQRVCSEFLADMSNDLPNILCCDWNFSVRVNVWRATCINIFIVDYI